MLTFPKYAYISRSDLPKSNLLYPAAFFAYDALGYLEDVSNLQVQNELLFFTQKYILLSGFTMCVDKLHPSFTVPVRSLAVVIAYVNRCVSLLTHLLAASPPKLSFSSKDHPLKTC